MRKSKSTKNNLQKSAEWLNSAYQQAIQAGAEQIRAMNDSPTLSELHERVILETANYKEKELEDTKNSKRQKRSPTDKIEPKEKTSLLKIIYILVKNNYAYDSSRTKHADISKVHRLFERADIKIDRKTLKKYIDEAFEYIGPADADKEIKEK